MYKKTCGTDLIDLNEQQDDLYMARVVGLSGPSGHHFCFHCLAIRQDLVDGKGKSYGLHELGYGGMTSLKGEKQPAITLCGRMRRVTDPILPSAPQTQRQ